jgi:hypothetical protein
MLCVQFGWELEHCSSEFAPLDPFSETCILWIGPEPVVFAE